MHRLAVTGHRDLSPATAVLVDQAIRAALRDHAGAVTGLSNLADGADHIFARAVLDAGGALEAFIPAREFRAGLPRETHREYDDLLALASAVHDLPYIESNSESHMAASKLMIDSAHELFAVWDGQPARAYGGTADAVAYARERQIPIRLIWPPGSRRE
jgi:hypothetical protein